MARPPSAPVDRRPRYPRLSPRRDFPSRYPRESFITRTVTAGQVGAYGGGWHTGFPTWKEIVTFERVLLSLLNPPLPAELRIWLVSVVVWVALGLFEGIWVRFDGVAF